MRPEQEWDRTEEYPSPEIPSVEAEEWETEQVTKPLPSDWAWHLEQGGR